MFTPYIRARLGCWLGHITSWGLVIAVPLCTYWMLHGAVATTPPAKPAAESRIVLDADDFYPSTDWRPRAVIVEMAAASSDETAAKAESPLWVQYGGNFYEVPPYLRAAFRTCWNEGREIVLPGCFSCWPRTEVNNQDRGGSSYSGRLTLAAAGKHPPGADESLWPLLMRKVLPVRVDAAK